MTCWCIQSQSSIVLIRGCCVLHKSHVRPVALLMFRLIWSFQQVLEERTGHGKKKKKRRVDNAWMAKCWGSSTKSRCYPSSPTLTILFQKTHRGWQNIRVCHFDVPWQLGKVRILYHLCCQAWYYFYGNAILDLTTYGWQKTSCLYENVVIPFSVLQFHCLV